MLSKDLNMEAHKRRYKKEKNYKSHKHERQILEKQRLSEGEASTSSVQDQAAPSEEDTKIFNKKVSTSVLKQALDKKSKRIKMSTKENKSREEIVAAREAKKLAKQKVKNKDTPDSEPRERKKSSSESKDKSKERKKSQSEDAKSQDEVDKAVIKDKDQILAERAAKKAAKQAQKKGAVGEAPSSSNMTVKDVVETLRDIKNVAKEVKEVTAKVRALDLEGKKESEEKESGKSKAELKAERRAKQEAQRAAKQTTQDTAVKAKAVTVVVKAADTKPVSKEKPTKRATEKKRVNTPGLRRNWFGQDYNDTRKHLLKLPINSNIHTAFINLGVQLATGVVRDSNARFVALLDALKKMTKDYILPPKSEFSRGLEAHLSLQLEFLSRMRQWEAAERNAVKFYRHLLTQLAHNVTEYEAKEHLQEEIDRYISEQIDKAGEAIGAAVRRKISHGDNVLTYGFSSLIERILVDAHEAGVTFTAFVCSAGGEGAAAAGAREMERRLAARGLSVAPVDIRNVPKYMCFTNKVLLGASCVLNTGSVLGPAGTAVLAQQASLSNVPVLVACETHKFSEGVQTDAFVNNELGDPADIIDDSSELSGRSNPDLAILNLTYDVTPPKFVTAVVTELAILPCTSAPIVHRIRSNALNA